MENNEAINLLIESAKRRCKITWSDNDTDLAIKEMVEDSLVIMKSKLGMSEGADIVIFTQPGRERDLWKNYVLYMWNNQQDMFDSNYLSEIMQARRKYEV